jgi:D-alanyl-D-alanine carboxypeptidase (penicillin-binding protein 5/6)
LGTSIVDTHNAQTPAPTASTAKMITALMILKVKPLALNAQGPTVTLSPSDVAIFNNYSSEQGSVVPVQTNEKISEYQMLEAMLLPSANNTADSLAIWAYGSLANYANSANSYLHLLGLNETHIGSDASGFLPNTVSSAHDLVKIGEMVLGNPVLAQIVSQTTASGIPVVNNVKNVNYLLGSNNIVGIKTGNTDQAGGVFVGAAKKSVDGTPVIVVTANVGAPTLGQAVSGSLPLILSAQANFKPYTLIKTGTVLGNYELPWDKSTIPAIVNQNVVAFIWGGSTVSFSIPKLGSVTYPTTSNQVVGVLESHSPGLLNSLNVSIEIAKPFTKPTLFWRFEHPKT